MSEKIYGYFVDNELVEGPKELPKVFQTPSGDTIMGFDKLEKENPDKLIELGWYEVDESKISVEIDDRFERIIYSAWYLENNILKRDYVIQKKEFNLVLSTLFNILDKNREMYEVSGFKYNYNNQEVIILTDRESSQNKLTVGEIKAKDGVRLDTDVWKFYLADGSGTLVVQLSNEDLLQITDFVYRKIQDSYNLTSQIAWEMLGAGNTETLQQLYNDGTIDLNPWNSGETLPWPY